MSEVKTDSSVSYEEYTKKISSNYTAMLVAGAIVALFVGYAKQEKEAPAMNSHPQQEMHHAEHEGLHNSIGRLAITAQEKHVSANRPDTSNETANVNK